MASPSQEIFFNGVAFYVVLLFSLSFHESAHAWMALRMGDDTAAREGRISLNPMVHIDPIGTVLIPLLQIFWNGLPLLAWAKPTPVSPHRFRAFSRGHVLVSFAGPASNLILAVVFSVLLFATARLDALGESRMPLFILLVAGVKLNILLAVFNLIPLPPLDGSKIVSFGLPRQIADQYDRVVEPLGPWLLLVFVYSGLVSIVLTPFMTLTQILIHFLVS